MSRKLALIIGNSEFEDRSLAQLVTPDADVNALAEVLRDPEVGGFDEVTALVNQPSTTVRRAIAGFFMSRGRDDLLLLYFSGHGIRDDRGQLFLAVRDTEHNLLRGTAIPAAYITEEMDNSRSRRQVLILDCCHSGAFSQGMKAAPGASVGTASAFEGTGSGRVVLTATDSTQYAWEGDRVIGQAENSVFTHHLINGLRSGEADADADGRVTLDELYNYAYEQVVYATPLQTPGKWSYGQRGEIVIARNPHPVVKAVELPSDLQLTIDDPRPWVREGAVQELDRILQGSHPGLALTAFEALQRLANDDSRRVASIASESLAAYRGTGQLKDAVGQETRIKQSSHLDQGSIGFERAEAQLDMEDIRSSEQTQPASTSQDQITQGNPVVRWITALKFSTKGHASTGSLPDASEKTKLWYAILWTTVGWAFCSAIYWVISEIYGWESTQAGIVNTLLWAIGGLITGILLRWTDLSFRWNRILMIAIGWPVAMFIGANVSMNIYDTWDKPINGLIRGIIGGLVTALALQQSNQSIHWRQIFLITIGWTVGSVISWVIGDIIYDAYDLGTYLWAIPGALTGAITGAIGSLVMYWQLSQRRDST